MSDSKHSNRHKKRVVQEGLRELKGKPGWDVSAFTQRDVQVDLRDFEQQLRGNQVYVEAGGCDDCNVLRKKTKDDTALCDEHLAEAMGFGS